MSGRFSFLHAADVHLDSPLRGLSRYDGAPEAEIRGATRAAFTQLVDLALERRVDFVLIAGDLYDGDWRDYNTGLFFVAEVARLAEAAIPVLVIAGNHDAQSQITRRLRLPEHVHLFATGAPETRRLDGPGVAVHGQGFATREVTADLSAGYPPPVEGLFNIGMLHTALTGREGHASYAPCTVDGLRARGYDYWALGHVHRREIVSESPWIVFPGNLQGRHARETGDKGATLVDVVDGAVEGVEHVALDVVRWLDVAADVEGCNDLDAALARVDDALAGALAEADGRLAAVRLRLAGRTPADTEIRARREYLVAECRALAAAIGTLWLERVAVETAPAIDAAAALERDDAFGGLLRAIAALDADDEALAAYAADFDDLRRKLPGELVHAADGGDPTSPQALRGALEDVKAMLVERLLRAP